MDDSQSDGTGADANCVSTVSSDDEALVADVVSPTATDDDNQVKVVDAPSMDDTEDGGLVEVDEDALKTLNTRPTPERASVVARTREQTGWWTRRRVAIVAGIGSIFLMWSIGNAVF